MSSFDKFDTVGEYYALVEWISNLLDTGRISEYEEVQRWYAKNDLFYLLSFVLSDGRDTCDHTGLPLYHHDRYLKQCKDLEWSWTRGGSFSGDARGTGKSTIRTKAGNIQRLLRWPDSRGLICSFEKQSSQRHFSGIQTELETNSFFWKIFPDLFFEDPKGAARRGEVTWNQDRFNVKGFSRTGSSLEHQNFQHGTPTGGRFDWIDLDDVENHTVVGNPDFLSRQKKVYGMTAVMLTPTVIRPAVLQVTNTFYSEEGVAYASYKSFKRKSDRQVSVIPGEDLSIPGDGPMGGTPRYPYSKERLFDTYDRFLGDKADYATQICVDFRAGHERVLEPEWIAFYTKDPEELGKECITHICIDPTGGKNDPACIWVWGCRWDRKFYWLDCEFKVIDSAHKEFYDEIARIYAKWHRISKGVSDIRVEDYFQQNLTGHVRREIGNRGLRGVEVIRCNDTTRTRKFVSGKRDREYARLAPVASNHNLVLPKPASMGGPGLIRTIDWGDGTKDEKDLVQYFLDHEWNPFPNPDTDDMLDAASLMFEPEDRTGKEITYPSMGYSSASKWRNWSIGRHKQTTWMSA